MDDSNTVYIITVSAILAILTLMTIIGNVFVIAAIILERNLRTAGNYLVLSLAVADLMVACLVMPLGAVSEVTQEWTMGTFLCDIWTSADVLCCTASILHLLAIAMDRYWAVTYVDYIHKRTPTRICVMIFLVWTVAAIVSIAPLFGWKDPDFNHRVLQDKRCLISQDIGYQVFATIATFYGPLIFILLLYWKIYQVARKRIRHKPGKTIRPASDNTTKVMTDTRESEDSSNSSKKLSFKERLQTSAVVSKPNYNQDTIITESATEDPLTIHNRQLMAVKSNDYRLPPTTTLNNATTVTTITGAHCKGCLRLDVKQLPTDIQITEVPHPHRQPHSVTSQLNSCHYRPHNGGGETAAAAADNDHHNHHHHSVPSTNYGPSYTIDTNYNNSEKQPSPQPPGTNNNNGGISEATSPPSSSTTRPSTVVATTSTIAASAANHMHSNNQSTSHTTRKTIRESIEAKRERKAAKILAIITGIFVICWLPFFVNALLMPLCKSCEPSKYVFSTLVWLGYLNSLLNPIIYTIFSPDFRNGFRRILCGKQRRNN